MNAIAAAILHDVGLSNNGYAGKIHTIANVVRATKAPLGEVRNTMDTLANEGKLRYVGTFDRQTYYCLPEHYSRVQSCLLEWAA